MVTKVQKWGNSLGLRLPKKLADDLEMATGTEVDIVIEKGRLVLTLVRRKKLKLEDLLAKVKSGSVHHEVDMGDRRGGENW